MPYNAKAFMVAPGQFDFSLAPMYDEEYVRSNINRVKRPSTAIVKAPTAIKVIEVREEPNFIELNKGGLREVSRLNLKKAQLLRSVQSNVSTTTNKASKRTQASSNAFQGRESDTRRSLESIAVDAYNDFTSKTPHVKASSSMGIPLRP